MKPSHILIVENMQWLAELIRDQIRKEYIYREISLEYCMDEKRFKEQLDKTNPDETLVISNSTFKSHTETGRFKLEGIKRLIKRGLRITWFKLHPVLVYGTIPEEEIFSSCDGRIFSANQSHKYFNLTMLRKSALRLLIERISPIQNEENLKTYINTFCAKELSEFVRSVEHHPLSKLYKLAYENERKEILYCLEHLQKLVYEDWINKSVLNQTINLIGVTQLRRN